MENQTFEFNKKIRNNATRILIAKGVPVKDAINMIKKNLPYLFASKKRISEVENSFNNIQ